MAAITNNSTPPLTTFKKQDKPPIDTTLKDKVDSVAKESLKEPVKETEKKKRTCKEVVSHALKKVIETIKKIFSCLCKFFCCCCVDDDSMDDYENYPMSSEDDISNDDIPLSDSLDEVQEFFDDVYKGSLPSSLKSKLTNIGIIKGPKKETVKVKTETNPFKIEETRKQKIEKILGTAKSLTSELNALEVPKSFAVKGQPNITGNHCYTNSVLQCLEGTYGIDPEECLPLISQDLSLQEGETLIDLEARLLHAWRPIPIPTEEETLVITTELSEKEVEYSEIQDKFKEAKKVCRNQILTLQNDLRRSQDRILFKWTYLLLLQAKLKGKPKTEITDALKLHHNVCFTLGLHSEFKAYPTEQKDSASYLEYWNDMMGISCEVAMQRISKYENEQVILNDQPVTEAPIQVQISTEKDLKVAKKPHGLVSLLSARFLQKMRPSNGGKENKCSFTLSNNTTVSLDTYNEVSSISCQPPKYLTYHFKRFLNEFVKDRYRQKKVTSKLLVNKEQDFGTLDFSPFFRKSVIGDTPALYELTNFVVHHGSTIKSGHFVNYTKRDGVWYYFSDSYWKPISQSKLPLEDAYMVTFKHVS